MRRFLSIAILLAVSAYLTAAFVWLNKAPAGTLCQQVNVVVEDSATNCFITSTEVTALLKQKRLYPVGKIIDSIRCREMETVLEKNAFIENAECYKTPSGNLCICIHQRIPILRVMPDNSSGYYIDSEGNRMPGDGHAAHLPVATGAVTQKLAESSLFELARLLDKDDFWGRQIEQINVTRDGDLELVPQVGDHILFLGKPVHLEDKLDRIRTFYEKALSRVGWNKYSRISVEFDNQVICKKRKE